MTSEEKREIEENLHQLRFHLKQAARYRDALTKLHCGLHWYDNETALRYIETLPNHVRGVVTTTERF